MRRNLKQLSETTGSDILLPFCCSRIRLSLLPSSKGGLVSNLIEANTSRQVLKNHFTTKLCRTEPT